MHPCDFLAAILTLYTRQLGSQFATVFAFVLVAVADCCELLAAILSAGVDLGSQCVCGRASETFSSLWGGGLVRFGTGSPGYSRGGRV